MPRPLLGVLAILALFLVIGLAIRWAMRAGGRLSKSGREMSGWKKW